MYHILIVEDQKEISDIVVKYVEKENWTCQLASNGFEALEYFSNQVFHMVILDIMMPGINGFDVLKNIRQYSDVPVILLTAKESEVDRITGFEVGADDYVIKPFSPRELIKRIQVIFKRVYGEDKKIYQYLDLILDEKTMTLKKMGVDIAITVSEFKLLKVFIQNPGQIMSRDQIISLAYGYDYDGVDRNIDSSIKRLRAKIEENPKQPLLLQTKYGAGYIFGGPDVN